MSLPLSTRAFVQPLNSWRFDTLSGCNGFGHARAEIFLNRPNLFLMEKLICQLAAATAIAFNFILFSPFPPVVIDSIPTHDKSIAYL